MARQLNGWIRIDRKLLRDDISQRSPETLVVWIALLCMANIGESNDYLAGQKKKIQKGQLVSGVEELSQITKVTVAKVKSALKYLKMTGRITDEVSNKGRVISIVKWSEYQSNDRSNDRLMTDRSPTDDFQVTDRSPTDDRLMTTSEQLTINNSTIEQENKEQLILPATAPLIAVSVPVKKARPKKNPLETELNKRIWQSYEDAYLLRYKEKPARNATVNGQISNLGKRLGEEAVQVIAFYVGHQDGFYIKKCHPVGLCLSDAESLRTQWARNFQVTATKVRQFEKAQSTQDTLDYIKENGI